MDLPPHIGAGIVVFRSFVFDWLISGIVGDLVCGVKKLVVSDDEKFIEHIPRGFEIREYRPNFIVFESRKDKFVRYDLDNNVYRMEVCHCIDNFITQSQLDYTGRRNELVLFECIREWEPAVGHRCPI